MNKRLLLLFATLITVSVINADTNLDQAITSIHKARAAMENKNYPQLVAALETASQYSPVLAAPNVLNIALNMARKLKDEAQFMQPSQIESDLLVIKRSINSAMQQLMPQPQSADSKLFAPAATQPEILIPRIIKPAQPELSPAESVKIRYGLTKGEAVPETKPAIGGVMPSMPAKKIEVTITVPQSQPADSKLFAPAAAQPEILIPRIIKPVQPELSPEEYEKIRYGVSKEEPLPASAPIKIRTTPRRWE